jgi:hypothetical protein
VTRMLKFLFNSSKSTEATREEISGGKSDESLRRLTNNQELWRARFFPGCYHENLEVA